MDKDRYGLAARRPEALIDLPAFPGDALDPDYCGGDLCVQACADDPQVAFHAVRNLARLARGLAVMRWTQLGFGRTSSTSRSQETPRNLMGFKDGTNNLKAEDTALMEKHVWVGASDQPSWMRGGTYLVARRIRMALEVWDHNLLEEQEWVIGREKVSGAPLGKKQEFDLVDLEARDEKGNPLVPARSHVRLAIGDGDDQDTAPRLLLHRWHGRAHGPARRRAVLHRLPARPARAVRAVADEPGAA